MIARPALRARAARLRVRSQAGLSFGPAFGAMRDGATLRLEYGGGRARWSVGDEIIHPEVAALLLQHPSIEAAGDTLFPELTPSQSWRVAERSD
jgi:hypothetical protein